MIDAAAGRILQRNLVLGSKVTLAPKMLERRYNMLATTAERVRQNTSEAINESIRKQTEENVARYAASDPLVVERRLRELDHEWDIERCVETMAPTISLIGLFLAATGSRKWLLLPAVVQGFFLQHALQGWCPPIPVLRRLGVRTQGEIEEERYALKALRGDFRHVRGQGSVGQAVAASGKR
jgi:hypothetical protein